MKRFLKISGLLKATWHVGALVFVCLLLAFIAFNIDWHWWLNSENRKLEKDYETSREAFKQALFTASNQNNTSIPIKKLTDFEWDRFCVIGGYENAYDILFNIKEPGNLEALKHYTNKEYEWTGIFLKEREIAAIMKYSRNEINLSGGENKCADHSTARIKVKKETIQIPERDTSYQTTIYSFMGE